ncbi:MAG: ABC transporter substrate-binding protein [Phenylobacterium sp.]|nr:MAG: ABC transporter substrate-binding protein [Phenylobacterium sp.]
MSWVVRLATSAALALILTGCGRSAGPAQHAGQLTVGFAQVGSESGWRSAETRMAQDAAKQRGVILKVADGQQRQENEIKAIRSFIAQRVDAIFLAPVVSTGWDEVLGEAREAKIPVILLDRPIETKDAGLYLSAVAADNTLEGRVAGEWLVGRLGGKACPVVELQGTVGSTLVANRKKGFQEAIAKAANIRIVRTQSGEFTRAKGKEVMEGFIKAIGGANICAVYAHNDDMMLGAIQAMKEAGLKPGKDILTVSIDGVPDIFQAMAAGEANATVELAPDMGARALDVLAAYRKTGQAPKFVQTPSRLFLPDTAAAEYARRKGLY